jgi:hypothetical protein
MRKCLTPLEAESKKDSWGLSRQWLCRETARRTKEPDMRRWMMKEGGPEQRLLTTEDVLEGHGGVGRRLVPR